VNPENPVNSVTLLAKEEKKEFSRKDAKMPKIVHWT